MFLLFILLVAGSISFLAQNKKQVPVNVNHKLRVTASFYPLYFFSSQIGSDKAEVKNITPAGAEPHDYEPTAQDIVLIEKSNLLILNGGKFEVWADKIRDLLKEKNVIIVEAAQDIANQQFEEEGKTIQDPHVWLSPPLAKKEVEHVYQGFVKVDAKNQNYYQINEKKLLTQLDDLDKKYKEGLKNCKQKDIVTSHAAFGYLAKTYDFNQVSITGISPDEEPSAQQLAEVAKFAEEHNVKYIFFESLVSPKLSETIAHEVGAQTLVLDPIEGISNEYMKAGKNYITIMQDNLKNLRIALECK